MAEYFFAQKPDVSFGLQILQAIIHVFCCSYFSRRSVLYSVFWLLFEKSCGEVDVFGCNLVASKPLRQVFSIIKAERFIRTFSVQFLSPVGIDMVHHQLYVCLRQFIKASSFRQDPAYKFMSHLDLCFLVRRTWIAVIDPRPFNNHPRFPFCKRVSSEKKRTDEGAFLLVLYFIFLQLIYHPRCSSELPW